MEAALDQGARFMVEDLLNFTLEVGEEDDDDEKTLKAPPSSCSLGSFNPNTQDPDDHQTFSFPECAEEELEWLSNKDAFPGVETYLDILSDNPGIVPSHLQSHQSQSPVSVLESSTTTSTTSTVTSCSGGSILVPVRYPVKARSKCRRRRHHGLLDSSGPPCWWWSSQVDSNNSKQELRAAPVLPPSGGKIGRRCQHCHAEKTPQWRAGPMGPKTLCNACGVRYKSGRLVPEYRPASSPTFSSLLHSNSHRKVMEMRRQKQPG
ncbi:hypothetical protein U1Q18_030832 [Sarracenia purpurea var. burkii]